MMPVIEKIFSVANVEQHFCERSFYIGIDEYDECGRVCDIRGDGSACMRANRLQRILLASDDAGRISRLRSSLGSCKAAAGCEIVSCGVEQAASYMDDRNFDVLFIDVVAAGETAGGGL